MSWERRLEYVGKREISEQWSSTVSCPTGYKYYTCVGEMLGTPQLLYLDDSTTYLGGAFSGNAASVPTYSTGTGTDQPLLGASATKVTPFKIKNQKIKYYVRNNCSYVMDLTVFEIVPRTLIPNSILAGSASSLTTANCIPVLVHQGVSDKLSVNAVQTQGASMKHSVASVSDVESIRGIAYDELSLKPPLTLYDSNLFTSYFKVVKQSNVTLKPGDEAEITVTNPDMFFLDGIEPYMEGTALMFEFSKFVYFGLVGHVGHITTPTVFGLEPASAADTNRNAARKSTAYNCSFTSGFIDVVAHMTAELEVFNGTLIEPLIGMIIPDDVEAAEMADAMIQSVPDLN